MGYIAICFLGVMIGIIVCRVYYETFHRKPKKDKRKCDKCNRRIITILYPMTEYKNIRLCSDCVNKLLVMPSEDFCKEIDRLMKK